MHSHDQESPEVTDQALLLHQPTHWGRELGSAEHQAAWRGLCLLVRVQCSLCVQPVLPAHVAAPREHLGRPGGVLVVTTWGEDATGLQWVDLRVSLSILCGPETSWLHESVVWELKTPAQELRLAGRTSPLRELRQARRSSWFLQGDRDRHRYRGRGSEERAIDFGWMGGSSERDDGRTPVLLWLWSVRDPSSIVLPECAGDRAVIHLYCT